MKQYFQMTKPYRFEITDLTALIYAVCAVLGMAGKDTSVLFLIGSAISTAFCWQARRINLIILNLSLFIFNIYCVFG